MVSEPVTLGGGIETTNGLPALGSGWNTPRSSQYPYQRDSTCAGS